MQDREQDTSPELQRLDALRGTQSRRVFLRRGIALGLAIPAVGSLLAACGGGDKATATRPAATTASTAGSATPTTASATTAASSSPVASPTASRAASASPTTATTSTAATTPSVASGSGSGTAGATLVIGRDISDLLTFDPAVVYEVSSSPINEAVYPALLINDPADITKYQPVLCEEVPSVENGGISADLMTFTVKLRKGVKYHTGKEMKAQDFVFMLQRLAYSLKNPSYFADPFVTKDAQGNITAVNVTALDDYTVQYTLAEPNIAALAALTTPAGVPYDADAARQQGALNTADAATGDTAQAWFDQHSAGVGPYMLKSWTKEDSVVLERFADWTPLGAPYDSFGGFDTIVFKQVAGSGQQLQQLEANAIQVAMELDADAVKTASGDGDLSVASGQSLNLVFLALNVDPTIGGPLADVKVRQAVAWSLDYDGALNGLLGGGGVRPASPVPLGFLGTDTVQDKAYTQDTAKAKALLQEANQPSPELTLTYGSGGSNDGVANETLAAKLQADLQAVGFTVTLNPEAADQRLADFRAAKLQLTFSGWIPGLLDVSDYATAFGGVQGAAPSNRVNYVSDANTQLLAAGIQESDPAKREQDYVQVMENLIEDAPFIPLWQANFQYGVGKGITNVVTHPSWLLMTHLIAPG